MTRTNRFLGGLTFGYLNMAIVTLAGLWLTAFFLGRLGESQYGLWLVVAQVLAYLGLLDLGVVALLPREVAYATGRDPSHPTQAVAAAARETLTLALWQVPLVIAAAVAVLLLLPPSWAPLRGPLTLVLVAFVLAFPARVLHALLRGLQDLAFLGLAQTIAWAAGTVVSVSLVLAGRGLHGLALGWITAQAVAPLLWGIRLVRRFPGTFPTHPMRLAKDVLRSRLRASGWVSVSQVAQVLVAGTDLLIVGRVLGPGTVVLYFCTAKLVMVLANQPQMLMEAAQPGLAQMRTGESRERLTQVCAALTQAMLVLSGIVVCVVLGVNRGFVTWWVGADRFGGLALTSALLGAMVLRHWNTTTVYALFAFGRERRIALTTLADGVVTVGAQIGLAYLIGPLGVAIGSIAGVLLVSLPVNLAGLGQETTGLAPILKSLVPWAWRLALATAVAAAFATTWQPSHVPGLVAATLALATVYAALVLPLLLRGTLATYVQPQLARLRAALFTAEAT